MSTLKIEHIQQYKDQWLVFAEKTEGEDSDIAQINLGNDGIFHVEMLLPNTGWKEFKSLEKALEYAKREFTIWIEGFFHEPKYAVSYIASPE